MLLAGFSEVALPDLGAGLGVAFLGLSDFIACRQTCGVEEAWMRLPWAEIRYSRIDRQQKFLCDLMKKQHLARLRSAPL